MHALAQVLLAFLLALVLTVSKRVHLDQRDAHAHYIAVPKTANRFETPWRLPMRVRFRTLRQSHHRIIYSALREHGGEGLGHHMRTIAADVGLALRLGVSYSHRKPSHGSLSREDPDAVDKLFNWGNGHVARNFLRDAVCDIDDAVRHNENKCPVCTQLRPNNLFDITRIVVVPHTISYAWGIDDEFGGQGQEKVHAFLNKSENHQDHSVLQLPPGDCEHHLSVQFVGPQTNSYFFHRYWDAHGSAPHLQRFGHDILDVESRRPTVQFAQGELNVIIHARRGDFFKYGRPRVSTVVYGKLLRNFMGVVLKQGGPFARMPVTVHLYSEGMSANKDDDDSGHDMARRTTTYLDADGAPLNEELVRTLLYDEEAFPNGFRVEMKISMNTIRTVHEMVSGDVFLGSESSFSSVVTQALSRAAVVLLPMRKRKFVKEKHRWREKTRSYFDNESGDLLDEAQVGQLWKSFCRFNDRSALRAVCRVEEELAQRERDRLKAVSRPAFNIYDDDIEDDVFW